MIIEIPIHYQLTVKMPKAKNTRTVTVVGTHHVDVPEAAEAALVAEIDADGWMERADGSCPRHKVYLIDGEFWATTFKNDRGDDAEKLVTLEVFKDIASRGGDAAGMTVVGNVPSPHWEDVFPSEEEVMAKTIVSSTRDAACAEQEAEASKLRIHDGLVLRKVSEPVYQIRWLEKTDELYVRHRFLDSVLADKGHVSTADERFIWRLDRFEQMLDRMERFHVSTNRARLEPAVLHRPDVLTWNRAVRQLVSRFNRDLESYAERHAFSQDTVEQFGAFAMLRDNGPLSHESSSAEIARTISLVLDLRERLGLAVDQTGVFEDVLALHADMLEDDAEAEHDMNALAATI